GTRCDAKEAGFGVDRVETSVGTGLHPADVVTHRLDLPARQRRHHHREVGLAAGARERAGDVARLALGIGELQDEHVFGEPAVAARHGRGNAQREALLAQEGVAAVTRTEGDYFAGLGEVHDVLVFCVAGPRDVLFAVLERRAHRV